MSFNNQGKNNNNGPRGYTHPAWQQQPPGPSSGPSFGPSSGPVFGHHAMHQPPYDPMMVGHPQVHDPNYLGPPAALFPSSQRQGPWKWQEKERERDEAIKARDEWRSKYEKLQLKLEQDARVRALEIEMQQRMDEQLANVKQQHAAKAAEPKKRIRGTPARHPVTPGHKGSVKKQISTFACLPHSTLRPPLWPRSGLSVTAKASAMLRHEPRRKLSCSSCWLT